MIMNQCLYPYPPSNNFGYYNRPDIPYYPEARPFPCEIKQEVFEEEEPHHHHSNVQPPSVYQNTHMRRPHTEKQNYQLPKFENEISGLFDPHRHPLQVNTEKRPFSCEICKIFFWTHDRLLDHRKTHQSRCSPSERAKFQCHLCPKKYISWYNLLSHIREHQCPRVGFQCEICHKILKTKAGLTMHKRRHDGQVNYACKLCWKASFSPSEHNRHFRTHWRETPQDSMKRLKNRRAPLLNAEIQDSR